MEHFVRCFCESCIRIDCSGRKVSAKTAQRHQNAKATRRIARPKRDRRVLCFCSQHPDGHTTSHTTYHRHQEHSRGVLGQTNSDSYETEIFDFTGGDFVDLNVSGASDENVGGNPDKTPYHSESPSDDDGEDDRRLFSNFAGDDSFFDDEMLDELNSQEEAEAETTSPDLSFELFLKCAKLQTEFKMPRACMAKIRSIFNPLLANGIQLPSLRYAQDRFIKLTGIHPRYYDCCINSCVAYTGDRQVLTVCPVCQEPRYTASQLGANCTHGRRVPGQGTGGRRAREQFVYFPLASRLRLQWKHPERARLLKTYRRGLEQTHEPGIYRDVFDGDLHRDYHQRNISPFSP